jgi:hypothetical protein
MTSVNPSFLYPRLCPQAKKDAETEEDVRCWLPWSCDIILEAERLTDAVVNLPFLLDIFFTSDGEG